MTHWNSTTPGHFSCSDQRFERANQDCLGLVRARGDDVEGVVDAIQQENVHVACRPKHDLGSLGAASSIAVGSGVSWAQVSFGFYDFADTCAAAYPRNQ